jgi:hypothetical protein
VNFADRSTNKTVYSVSPKGIRAGEFSLKTDYLANFHPFVEITNNHRVETKTAWPPLDIARAPVLPHSCLLVLAMGPASSTLYPASPILVSDILSILP